MKTKSPTEVHSFISLHKIFLMERQMTSPQDLPFQILASKTLLCSAGDFAWAKFPDLSQDQSQKTSQAKW